MSDDPEEEKAEALKRIAEVPEKCGAIESLARDLLKASTEARDTAKLDEVVIRVLPANTPGASQIFRDTSKKWETFSRVADQTAKATMYNLMPFTAVVSGTASTTSLGIVEVVRLHRIPDEAVRKIRDAEEHYEEKLDISRLLEDVKSEMSRLRLDAGPEAFETPLQLLDAAYYSVRFPVSAQAAKSPALVTLRTAINNTIVELIRRRDVPEPAGSREEKILSIGRKASRAGLPSDRFDELATDYHRLTKELSGEGKRGIADQEHVVRTFHAGALFLRALLQSVDEALLKAP